MMLLPRLECMESSESPPGETDFFISHWHCDGCNCPALCSCPGGVMLATCEEVTPSIDDLSAFGTMSCALSACVTTSHFFQNDNNLISFLALCPSRIDTNHMFRDCIPEPATIVMAANNNRHTVYWCWVVSRQTVAFGQLSALRCYII